MSSLKEIEEMVHNKIFNISSENNDDKSMGNLKNIGKQKILKESIKVLRESKVSEEEIDKMLQNKFGLSENECLKIKNELNQ